MLKTMEEEFPEDVKFTYPEGGAVHMGGIARTY